MRDGSPKALTYDTGASTLDGVIPGGAPQA